MEMALLSTLLVIVAKSTTIAPKHESILGRAGSRGGGPTLDSGCDGVSRLLLALVGLCC